MSGRRLGKYIRPIVRDVTSEEMRDATNEFLIDSRFCSVDSVAIPRPMDILAVLSHSDSSDNPTSIGACTAQFALFLPRFPNTTGLSNGSAYEGLKARHNLLGDAAVANWKFGVDILNDAPVNLPPALWNAGKVLTRWNEENIRHDGVFVTQLERTTNALQRMGTPLPPGWAKQDIDNDALDYLIDSGLAKPYPIGLFPGQQFPDFTATTLQGWLDAQKGLVNR